MLEEIQKTWWKKGGRFNDNLYTNYLKARLKSEEDKAEKDLVNYSIDKPLYKQVSKYLVGSNKLLNIVSINQ